LKAEEAVTEISDQLAAIEDEKAALDAEARQADSIRAFSLDKLPKDAAVREIKTEGTSANWIRRSATCSRSCARGSKSSTTSASVRNWNNARWS
jgi:hypothetical protein